MQFHELTKRQATRVVDGVSFPIFIDNGGFYLTNLMVFEDGLVDCWETLDFDLFEEKVRSGGVRAGIPDGQCFRVHPFGELEVSSSDWRMSGDDLLQYVQDVIAQLNPKKQNLYDMHGSATEVINGLSYFKQNRSRSASWRPKEDDVFDERFRGETIWAYERVADGVDLAEVTIFENEIVSVLASTSQRELTFAEFKSEAAGGCFDFPETGDKISISGLGSFKCADAMTRGYTPERVIEKLDDLLRTLSGVPTTVDLCREAFLVYSDAPNSENLENLRHAYEAVPDHLRMYCGDMDSKDIPIRIVLYGDKEIENWSHWQASKMKGLPLPTLSVPRPTD